MEILFTSALITVLAITIQSFFNRISDRQITQSDPKLNEPRFEIANLECGLQTSISFVNMTNEGRSFWIEPYCVEFEVSLNWEFMLVTGDDSYTVEFRDTSTTIWLNDGFKLFKRYAFDSISNDWILEVDYSDF